LHVFGAGFPKSHNIGKAIYRLAGAEREVIGDKIRPDGRPCSATQKVGKENHHEGYRRPWMDDPQAVMMKNVLTAPATLDAAEWEGWGTGLKPSCETWWLVRKPISEKSIAQNVLRWGTGALNIDGCRVAYTSEQDAAPKDYRNSKGIGTLQEAYKEQGGRPYKDGFSYQKNDFVAQTHPQGRWPAHLVMSHSLFCKPNGTRRVKTSSHSVGDPGVYRYQDGFVRGGSGQTPRDYVDEEGYEEVEDWVCDESCPIWIMDRQSGRSKGYRNRVSDNRSQVNGSVALHDTRSLGMRTPENSYNDQGGASRYFQQFSPFNASFLYVPKASRRERNEGCSDLPARKGFDKNTSPKIAHINHSTGETTYNDYTPSANQNSHPTVKPVALLKYFCRMICPPGGIVLDMFAGSASTALACIEEEFHFIMIEESDTEEEPYVSIARARIAHALSKKKGKQR
jgi:site-specific DNA-methyltransferase (adenine-specific)